MRVSGDDGIDQPAWQIAREVEDLRVRIAGRQILRVREVLATAARVRTDDHHLRTGRSQARCFRRHRFGERSHPQPADIQRKRRPQSRVGHHADDADLDAGRVHQRRRLDIRPLHPAAGLFVEEICGEEREVRLGGARLQRTPRVGDRILAGAGAIGCAEIELVIANRQRGVAQCVVRVNDDRAFAQVRLDAALERVARVEQQHGTLIGDPGRAQVVDISSEDANAAAPAALHEIAVQIARTDDGDRDR